MDKPLDLSSEQVAELVANVTGAKENIFCEEHNFYPAKSPYVSSPARWGCKSCAMATILYDFATTPPHLRLERFAQLESLTKNLVKEVQDTGKIDFTFYEHPEITVEKTPDVPFLKD